MQTSPFAYVIALVVLLCFLAAAVVAVVLRGGNINAAAPLLTTLLGLFGPTIGILVLIIRQQHNITEVQQVRTLVNNHLNDEAKPPANGTPSGSPGS